MRSRSGVIDVSGYPLIPYARNSKPGKRRTVISVETQDFFIRDHCADSGERLWDGPTIVDPDMGAAFDAQDRPGWLRVMKSLETCEYGGIAVRDADRAARDGWIGEQLIRLVRQKNLKGFRVVSPIVTYDLSTQEGVSEFRKAIDDAEKEVDRIRRRTAQALRHKAMMGETTSGMKRVFGWIDKPVNIHEPIEAHQLHRGSVELVEGREDMPAQLLHLEEQKVRTVAGLPFNHARWKSVLLRESNAGIIRASGKDAGRLPGDPIVPEDLYRAVVAHFASINRGRPPSRTYLLSRLDVIRCEACGSRMHGGRVNKKAKPAYLCSYNPDNPKRMGCGRSILMTGVEAEVEAKTLAWWKDPKRANRDHLFVLRTSLQERRIRQQIDLIEDRMVALTERLDLAPERYERAATTLITRRDALAAQLVTATSPPVLESVTSEHVDKMWHESLESRREMIKAAIKTIYVRKHERPKGAVMSFDPGRLEWIFW